MHESKQEDPTFVSLVRLAENPPSLSSPLIIQVNVITANGK